MKNISPDQIDPADLFVGTWAGVVEEVESKDITIIRKLDYTITFTKITPNVVQGDSVYFDPILPSSDPNKVFTERILLPVPNTILSRGVSDSNFEIVTADGTGNGINKWTVSTDSISSKNIGRTINFSYNVSGNQKFGSLNGSVTLTQIPDVAA